MSANRSFQRRRPPRERYWGRSSESVAANDFEPIVTLTMDDTGTLMGARVCAGLTLASAGVSKAEMWLFKLTSSSAGPDDPTTAGDAGLSTDLIGFWECHLSQETPFNLNENISVRRKYNTEDRFQLFAKSQSGFDIEAMVLLWCAE